MLFLLLSCFSPKISPKPIIHQVRYRPSPDQQSPILEILPNATWDKGLEKATDELLLQLRSPQARIPHQAIRIALARVGFPAQARFAKVLNDGSFPKELVRELLQDVGKGKVDLALRSCSYGDGTTLWLLAWLRISLKSILCPKRYRLMVLFPFAWKRVRTKKRCCLLRLPTEW